MAGMVAQSIKRSWPTLPKSRIKINFDALCLCLTQTSTISSDASDRSVRC
jgi:hypothetical protein